MLESTGHRPRGYVRLRQFNTLRRRSYGAFVDKGRLTHLLSAAPLAAMALLLSTPYASGDAPAIAIRHACVYAGAPLIAYNLSCAKARRVRRHLPHGWTGANIDAGGGEALLFRKQDFNRVTGSIDSKGSVDRVGLGRAPLVIWAEPYGE